LFKPCRDFGRRPSRNQQADPPVISFLPIILIAVLFGLAMDYEVFMVSRIREAFVETGEPTKAVLLAVGTQPGS
jgi:uncharacterized membrane protein YdfJ with MMPL/SSD domain